MNFLGHIVLARPVPESRLGNFLGDFVKGRPETFADAFSPWVVDGILMHRFVDDFTDAHPAFKRAKTALSPEFKRFSGIIIDVFFDHFLSIHWEKLNLPDRHELINSFYTDLKNFPRHNLLDDAFYQGCERLCREDWLRSYITLEGMETTFQRISKRSPRLTPLSTAAKDLRNSYDVFDSCFAEFLPAVIKVTNGWKHERPIRLDANSVF